MGEAVFYQLGPEPPEAVLPRLLDRARAEGWDVEVRGTDAARMDALDLALWGEGDAFLPHGRQGGPHDARQPVLLTTAPARPPRACLVALDGAAVDPGEVRAAARTLVVFGADALDAARGQWKAMTDAGLAARYFAREGGAWVLKRAVEARA